MLELLDLEEPLIMATVDLNLIQKLKKKLLPAKRSHPR